MAINFTHNGFDFALDCLGYDEEAKTPGTAYSLRALYDGDADDVSWPIDKLVSEKAGVDLVFFDKGDDLLEAIMRVDGDATVEIDA